MGRRPMGRGPQRPTRARLFAAVLALSCGPEIEIPKVDGLWTGSDVDGTKWELELVEYDVPESSVGGTYLLHGGGSLAYRGAVTGRYEYPSVASNLVMVDPRESLVWRCSFRGTMAHSGQSFAGTVVCTGAADWTSPLDFHRIG